MAQMARLTERERKVLVAMTLRADAPVKELAKRTGLKEHSVRYVKNALIESGLIEPVYLVDNYRLGYTDFGVFLTRGAESSRGRAAFEKQVQNIERVSWLAKTGGDFQYGLTFLARRSYELDDLFSVIRPPGQGAYFEKLVGLRIDWTIYSPKYLFPDLGEKTEVTMTTRSEPIEVDDEEHDTLMLLAKNPGAYLSILARQAKINPTSLHYRLEKLRKKNVLRCQMYLIHLEKLGISTYRILIVERSMSANQRTQFRAFCAAHPNVAVFLRCTGAWDYEVRFETPHPEDLDTFCQALFDSFGTGIGSIRIVQQFRVLKRSAYPGR